MTAEERIVLQASLKYFFSTLKLAHLELILKDTKSSRPQMSLGVDYEAKNFLEQPFKAVAKTENGWSITRPGVLGSSQEKSSLLLLL